MFSRLDFWSTQNITEVRSIFVLVHVRGILNLGAAEVGMFEALRKEGEVKRDLSIRRLKHLTEMTYL